MAKYYEKSSVMAIATTFGDEDICTALSALTEYNDDANRINYGEWQDIERWELFEPGYLEGNFIMRKIVFHSATCSNCHGNITIDDYDNYCPRCGARMSYAE